MISRKFKAFLLLLVLLPGFQFYGYAQQAFTPQQVEDISRKVDSIMNLYNRYGSFSQDYGNYSGNYARQFVALFDAQAFIFNDADIHDKNPAEGISPRDYADNIKRDFPGGFGKMKFSEDESRTKPQKRGNNYEVKLTGRKEINAFTSKNEIFNRDIPKYTIVISFSPALNDFRITESKPAGASIIPPRTLKDVEITITDNRKKPIADLKVALYVDSRLMGEKITKENGRVFYGSLPTKGNEIVIKMESADSTYYEQKTFSFNDLKAKEGKINIEIQKKELTNLVLKICSSYGDKPVQGAVVRGSWNVYGKNYTYSGRTNEAGQITIAKVPTNVPVAIKVDHPDYEPYSENKTVSSKSSLPVPVVVAPRSEMFIGAGINVSFILPRVINSQPTAPTAFAIKPFIGIGPVASAGFFPAGLNFNTTWIGFMAGAGYTLSKFTSNAPGYYTDKMAFTDIENDECELNVQIGQINETYRMSVADVFGGVIIKKPLMQGRSNLSLGICPGMTILTRAEVDLKSYDADYYGIYSKYADVEIRDNERFGYGSEVILDNTNDNSIHFKKIMPYLLLNPAFDLSISENLCLDISLPCYYGFAEMMGKDLPAHLTTILDQQTTKSYHGLLNLVESYKQSKASLSVSIKYKL